MCLVTDGLPRAEFAESDALTIVGPTPATIHKGRMEPMHVEVIIVDEEAFAYCRVPVIQRMYVKPSQHKKR